MTKLELEKLRFTDRMSLLQISKVSGISYHNLRKLFKQYGISLDKLPPEDLTNKKFNSWKVLYKDGFIHGNIAYVCECKCGNRVRQQSSTITNGLSKHCRKCQSKLRRHSKDSLSNTYWNKVKKDAARRGLDFSITKEYAWSLLIEQNKKCALSGVDIGFAEIVSEPNTASIDRIDSSKGYIKGNIQWVHKKVNFMKGPLTQDEFFSFCEKVNNVRSTKISNVW
jgi:hypothetical protein